MHLACQPGVRKADRTARNAGICWHFLAQKTCHNVGRKPAAQHVAIGREAGSTEFGARPGKTYRLGEDYCRAPARAIRPDCAENSA